MALIGFIHILATSTSTSGNFLKYSATKAVELWWHSNRIIPKTFSTGHLSVFSTSPSASMDDFTVAIKLETGPPVFAFGYHIFCNFYIPHDLRKSNLLSVVTVLVVNRTVSRSRTKSKTSVCYLEVPNTQYWPSITASSNRFDRSPLRCVTLNSD